MWVWAGFVWVIVWVGKCVGVWVGSMALRAWAYCKCVCLGKRVLAHVFMTIGLSLNRDLQVHVLVWVGM